MSATDVNLLRGTLDLLIMKSLVWGARHGFGIAEWIEAVSSSEILIEEGTLYPALHRLEKKGYLEAEWGLSEKNRKAKYYELTAAGRRQFQRESAAWTRYAGAVAEVLAQQAPEPA